MQNSTALPDLQVLPTALLMPHEDHDPRRVERLQKRMLEEGLLKNPPVVAPIPGSEKYVILDGANRCLSFAMAGIPHIVAQVVSYANPDLLLETWYHVAARMPLAEFESELTNHDGFELQACTLEFARSALAMEEALAYIITDDGPRLVIPPAGRARDLRLLTRLVSTYRGKADIYRASNDIWEIQKPYYADITALIVFPRLRPADILHAALQEEKIPSGITRHIIPARALNVNLPMGVMMVDWPVERKRQWLKEWLMERMAANAIRYYAESTFSFNE